MKDLINYLAGFATQRRFDLFREVAANRTRYITLVLEDIYQPHNASAVLRTCDCMGIQDIHIIEQRNKYKLNPDVELGSAQWLNLIRYNQSSGNTEAAIASLRQQGYRIIATTPHTNDITLEDLDLSKGKFALLFGTELNGLTPTAIDQSDEFIRIPMSGFTESLNISVSVAIAVYTLIQSLKKSELDWKLTPEEQDQLILDWLRKSIKSSDQLEKRFIFESQNKDPWLLNL